MSEPRSDLPHDRQEREAARTDPDGPIPASLVPLLPASATSFEVSGWHVWATFDGGAGPNLEGHHYLVDVVLAAHASGEVWEALAQAVLGGLCLRCSSQRETERLLWVHVLHVVVEHANLFAWTHAPVLDEPCPACEQNAAEVEVYEGAH